MRRQVASYRGAARIHRALGITLIATITAGTAGLIAGIAIPARKDKDR